MAVFTVHYSYDQRSADRDLYRPAHRGYLRELLKDGVLLASGPFTDAANPGALLIFRADSADDVVARLRIDPFMANGLVVAADIKEWQPVMGPWEGLD